MNSLMPGDGGNRRSDLLGGCGDFKQQAEFVRADFLDRFEWSHGTILAVDVDVKDIIITRQRRGLVIQLQEEYDVLILVYSIPLHD